jgi:hypothetical protein
MRDGSSRFIVFQSDFSFKSLPNTRAERREREEAAKNKEKNEQGTEEQHALTFRDVGNK